jgi:hypothetical protein
MKRLVEAWIYEPIISTSSKFVEGKLRRNKEIDKYVEEPGKTKFRASRHSSYREGSGVGS